MSAFEIFHFLIQLLIILGAAVFFGRLASRYKMPRMVGELCAGIFLGPTVFGRLAPHLQDWFFTAGSSATLLRGTLCACALLLFLFVAGLETRLPANTSEAWRVLSISFFGLLIPFSLSWALAKSAPNLFGVDGSHPWFPFFLGIALSISALPVIARIFIDLKLEYTLLASIVLSAAAMDDIAGWGLFAGLMWKMNAAGGASPLGFHGIFGAFLAGALCQRWRSTSFAQCLRRLTLAVCAPLYFAGLGLQLHLWCDFSPSLAALLLLLACAGKIMGAGLGSRLAGLSWREAFSVGCAMNARGAMEVILATVALERGIVTATLHTALVFVAVATSLMAGLCGLRDIGSNAPSIR